MRYIKNGNVKIPLVGFGSYKMGDDTRLEKQELDVLEYGYTNYGMTLLDTAEMYGNGRSEFLLSKFLANHKREDFYIIDKVLPENVINGHMIDSCKKSLERLGVSYIDLYLLHWRGEVDLQKMADEMETLVSLGYIKNWGVSNFDVNDMEDLFKCKNGNKCLLNQCLYNLSERGVEYDLIPWCQKHGVAFMAYSPLGHNKEYRKKLSESEDLKLIAKKNNESLGSLLLRFVLRNNNVVAAFKTSNVNHLKENMKDVFEPLSKEDLEMIDKAFPAPTKKVELSKI